MHACMHDHCKNLGKHIAILNYLAKEIGISIFDVGNLLVTNIHTVSRL